MPEYIEKGKIEKFIEDGLNNPDKNKAFGHDAIEIMTEIHYMPSEDVAPSVHGKWVEYKIPHIICCSVCDYGTGHEEKTKFCPNCGEKMDL